MLSSRLDALPLEDFFLGQLAEVCLNSCHLLLTCVQAFLISIQIYYYIILILLLHSVALGLITQYI